MKEFFTVCSLLVIIGFLVTPALLLVILPMIVDPLDMDDEDVSIDASTASETKEDNRWAIIDEEDRETIEGDDDDDDDDDFDERASF